MTRAELDAKNKKRNSRYASDPVYRNKVRTQQANSYKKNKKRHKARMTAYYRANRDAVQMQHLQYKFGITPEQYEAMLKKQKGVCAICKGSQVNGRKKLDVDHCHETGKIRGLLCGFCNRALGMLKHDPKLFELCVGYLTS